MLSPDEKNERDPAAIQRELLELAEHARALGEELAVVTQRYYEALRDRKMVQAKLEYVKQEISALQSVLKSLSQF